MTMTIEEPLEPSIPILDPHHHLWSVPGLGPYFEDDLVADVTSGHNVVGTVAVDSGWGYREEGPKHLRCVGETEFVAGIAQRFAASRSERPGFCAAIVSHADLFLGDAVAEVLEAHMEASNRFRGIRQVTAWDPDETVRYPIPSLREGMLLNPGFQQGFARLAPLGLSFDAWLFHPQIPELTALARTFPETQIVLDHFGGPLGIGPYATNRKQSLADWRSHIAELARCPNVVVKMGGLMMDVNGLGFNSQSQPPTSQQLVKATRDFYLHTIDCFGPNRCMFESNFPVDKAACSYTVLWNSFKRISAGFSSEERHALFYGNAERVYRLGSD